MNLNQAEFLLLARTGRGPYSTRAGPQPFGMREPPRRPRRPGRLFGKRGGSGLILRRGTGKGLRHGLGPRADRSPRISRTLDYADQEYFELEFAVGFPAEEESLL
jgi:hypothetical protein